MNNRLYTNSEERVANFNNILRELGLPIVELTKQGSKMERTKQDVTLDSVRHGMFIVGSVDANGTLHFAANPVVHETSNTARAECKRLAVTNPGKAFIFVKLSGAELCPAAPAVSI